jgi:uncharacterized membrane protein
LRHVIIYAATLLALLLCDSIWLTSMLPFYQHRLGKLLAEAPALGPAMAFYLLYAVGVVALAVRPAQRTGPWLAGTGRGALFGLVAYGTYDLTNQATLRDWPVALTVIDMGWGTALTAIAATIGTLVARRLHRSP